jgi:hypothetical protein
MAATTSSIPRLARGRVQQRHINRQVLPQEACVGSIIWISQRFPGDEDITCVRPGHCDDGTKIMDEGYMHPAVILKIWQRPGSTIYGDLILGISDVSYCQISFHCQLGLLFAEAEAGGKRATGKRDGYEETGS